MKIAVVSASLGGFDKRRDHIKQSIDCEFFHFDDSNFPPRYNAMTPRLQARIVKMFMFQFVPDYDYYLWVDSSCVLSHPDSVKWFMDKLKKDKIAVFKHPNRNSIQEEADYLKKRLSINCPYITPRYKNELIDEQLRQVNPDSVLLASTAFIYKDTEEVREAMKEWWYNTSRYHIIDQLSFTHALIYLDFDLILESYLKIPYLTYVRNK